MVMNCVVPGCVNQHVTGSKIKLHFYRFPKVNVELRKLWIAAMNKSDWEPKSHTRICSAHFPESDFLDGNLKADAVPSVFKSSKIRRISEAKSDVRTLSAITICDCGADIAKPGTSSKEPNKPVHVMNKNTTNTRCTRNSAKQMYGSPTTQLPIASTNTKDHMKLQTNVNNFEEVNIKLEPFEENTNDYKCMYDDHLRGIVKEENDGVEYDKDNTNEIDTKEECTTLRINQHNIQCDKEECIEKEKCTCNKNCSNDNQSCINNDILDTKHTNTNNPINKFKCSLCNKMFITNYSLQRHMRETTHMMSEINFPVEEVYIKEEVFEEPPLHNDSYDLVVKNEVKEENSS